MLIQINFFGWNTESSVIPLIVLFSVVGIFAVLLALFFRKSKELNAKSEDYIALNSSFLGVIDSSKDALILFNNTEKFAHANAVGLDFLKNVLGITVSEHLDLNTITHRFKNYSDKDFNRISSKGVLVEIENMVVEVAGAETTNYYIKIQPIIEHNKTSYFYILARDITSDIAMQNKANEHEYILSEIMTYSRDGYIIMDNEYIVKAVNTKALSFLEMDEKTMIGCSLTTLFPELEDSDLITNCEFAQIQKEPAEFDYFFRRQSAWFNIIIQPSENGLTLFLYENSIVKLNHCFNEAERQALEAFSHREISFFQIMAKSVDMFQELFPGMFCAVYTLNDAASELKYFSSGYSNFLPTIPKPIKSDFHGFHLLLSEKQKLGKDNRSSSLSRGYFDYLSDLFSYEGFTNIVTQPIFSNEKVSGIVLFYFKNELSDYSGISILQDKISFFVEKLFHYRTIFRELEKLSFVSENSQKAYATVNIDEQITWSNRSFSNLFKKSREDVYLKPITEIIDERNTPMKYFIQILDSLNNFSNLNITFPYTLNEQRVKQIQFSTHTIFSGDEIQLLIEMEDITEQANHEQQLWEKQHFLNKITNTVPIVLFQCKIDERGAFSLPFISKEAERLDIGYSIEEISNHPEVVMRMIHPDDLPRIVNAIEKAQRNLRVWNVEFRLITKRSKVLWINGVGVHELTDNGTYVWNGYLENITEKKEKSKEIERINARFTYASKAVNEVIWEMDLSNKSMTWSDGLATIFGYSKEFFPVMENLVDFIHPEDFEHYQSEIERHISNKNTDLFSAEYRFKKADDTYAFVIDRAFILRDEDGVSQRLIGSIKDVSEIKQFEKRKKELINETQEFERNQFSMELHDGLAQHLVALNLYLSHIETELDPSHREKIEMCKRIVLDSLNQTRTLCYNLSPPELSKGLIEGLKSLFDRLNVLNGIDFQFNCDGYIYPEVFENIDIYNVYRIIQEFINNSLKHAECTEISCLMFLEPRNNVLTIAIKDNGKGYDFANVKYGFGIQNMQKRSNLANATIKISSVIGEGSSLLITV